MNPISNGIDNILYDYFKLTIPEINVIDVLEIIIIAFFTYEVLKWIKNTRAWMLLRGLVVIAVFFIVAALFQMSTILWLGERLISVAFVALVVVFQPELRSALEKLGRNSMLRSALLNIMGRRTGIRFSDKTLNHIVDACMEMSKVKTGALIVMEKEVGLAEFINTGIRLDSVISRQLLINIFEKNTPLHDGAVIVRGDRIVSATCYLPLSPNVMINKELGTRHRAAIGISEVSDSVTIVVSEETGDVSIAEGGAIVRGLDSAGLKERLTNLQKGYQHHREGGNKNAQA